MNESDGNHDCIQNFRYPYTELLQWTILTRRYDMAMYMVMSGEESIAKVGVIWFFGRGTRFVRFGVGLRLDFVHMDVLGLVDVGFCT